MNSAKEQTPRFSHSDWEHLKFTFEKLSYCVRANGTTLLHMAVDHNDLGLIKNLLDTGYNVNARDSYGNTALLSAAKSLKYNIVKTLLYADTDICVTNLANNQTDLEILMNELRRFNFFANNAGVMEDIMPHIMGNLKRRNLDTEKLVELLVKIDCPLKFVWAMSDAKITRLFLQRNPQGNYETEMKLAMERRNLVNVELIMRYGNKSGRLAFYTHLYNLFMDNKIKSWQIFIERLPDWNFMENVDDSGHTLPLMYTHGNVEYIRILLNSEIHERVNEKYQIDIRACVFGNVNVDAVELMQTSNFDVNAFGIYERSALHNAVKNNLVKNVRFLLDSNADVDFKDERGRTPLFDAIRWNSIESARLLLEMNADVQIVDDSGVTLFEVAENKNPALLEFLIARLAIDGVQGVSIKDVAIQDHIEHNEDLKEFYETCCQQLRVLKTCEIVNPVTLFNVLTDKIETICRYLCNQNIIALLDQYKNVHELHLLYYSTLKSKLIKSLSLYQFKCGIADVIFHRTGKFVDFDHLVIRRISEYVTQKNIDDFLRFSLSSNEI